MRRLVALAAILALAAGCVEPRERGRSALGQPGDEIALLNSALALEWEAAAAYELPSLRDEPRVASFHDHHKSHAEALAASVKRLGGEPVAPLGEYRFAVEPTDRAAALRLAASLERGLASAYLGAVPALGDRDLARFAASIMGVEAMHWSQLREALGEPPIPAATVGEAMSPSPGAPP